MILALDLEGTLISTAVSVFPRAGLRAFLEGCRTLFEETALFSSVSPRRIRDILQVLDGEGHLPPGFLDVRMVHPGQGTRKDLRLLGDPAGILLVDDSDVAWPGQEDRLVPIRPFLPPYGEDAELARMVTTLARRVREPTP